jgi:glyoxylate reductase
MPDTTSQPAGTRALRVANVEQLHLGAERAQALGDRRPLPADHPLLEAPNLLVLPHLGSATHATRERMADMAVDSLLAGLAGRRMPHCANPAVYAA